MTFRRTIPMAPLTACSKKQDPGALDRATLGLSPNFSPKATPTLLQTPNPGQEPGLLAQEGTTGFSGQGSSANPRTERIAEQ